MWMTSPGSSYRVVVIGTEMDDARGTGTAADGIDRAVVLRMSAPACGPESLSPG
jgi:hypothetical protein